MVPRLSFLSCFVFLMFAVLVRSNGAAPRIYQNRIVSSNNLVILKSFEVVGLASVEFDSANRPTYYFVCNTTLNNGTGITWTRDGGISESMVEKIPTSSNGLRLTGITSLSHLGVYSCLDNYTNTSVSINITQDNPAVQPVNRVLRVMEGSNATASVYVSGYPLVTSNQIHWYRPNGTEILVGEAVFENKRKSLLMHNVQPSDAGIYLCQITTSYGNRSTTIQVEVYGSSPLQLYQGRVATAPDTMVTVEVFPVQELATVEFTTSVTYYLDCNTSRNDGSGIMWIRVGSDNPFQVAAIANGNGQRLQVDHLGDSSLGRYECFDTLSEDRASINITTENPAVSAVTELVEVLQGDHALLEVYVSAYPLVTGNHISWYGPNGSKILERDGVEFMNGGRALFLISVQSSAAGWYRCEVNVPANNRTRSVAIRLEVHENSLILSPPQMVTTVDEWTNTTLQCIASGNPPPSITWEREGGATPPTTVTVSTDTQKRVTSVLMFTRVRYRDGGRYRCVADNVHTPQVNSDYAQLKVTPKLIVSINISGETRPLQNAITVAEGTEVTLECFGSGVLQWIVSTGKEIATCEESNHDSYQEYDSAREVQLLHIRNFSRSDAAMYICRSNLTTNGRESVESAITLNRDPADDAVLTTSPEPQLDSPTAIVAGVVVGLILALMVALFMLVVMLLVIRRRSKGRASVGAEFEGLHDTVNQIENDDVHLKSVKSLELNSEASERSMQASSSMEKLNDDSPCTTEQMNMIL